MKICGCCNKPLRKRGWIVFGGFYRCDRWMCGRSFFGLKKKPVIGLRVAA